MDFLNKPHTILCIKHAWFFKIEKSPVLHTQKLFFLPASYFKVKLLCENAADYNAKLTDDRTALEIARSRSRKNVVDALHVIQLTQAAKKDSPGQIAYICNKHAN